MEWDDQISGYDAAQWSVVCHTHIAGVLVYNATSFQQVRQIKFTGLGAVLTGLVTSAPDNYLYIADNGNTCVHRDDLSVIWA